MIKKAFFLKKYLITGLRIMMSDERSPHFLETRSWDKKGYISLSTVTKIYQKSIFSVKYLITGLRMLTSDERRPHFLKTRSINISQKNIFLDEILDNKLEIRMRLRMIDFLKTNLYILP